MTQIILPKKESIKEGMKVFHEYDMKEIFGGDTPQKYWYLSRISEVIDVVAGNIKTGGRVLDVGCAQVNIPTILSEKDYKAVGLDLRVSALKYGRLRTEQAIPLAAGCSESLPFKDKTFDCVILGELLEHLKHPKKTLREAGRVLVDDGLIVITTPNRRSRKVLSYLDSRSAGHTPTQYEIDSHVFEFNEGELVKLVEESGLKMLKHRRMLLANIRWKIPVSLSLELAFKIGMPPCWIKQMDDFFVSILSRLPRIGGMFYGTHLLVCGKKEKKIQYSKGDTLKKLWRLKENG